jgi:hypothetical protein
MCLLQKIVGVDQTYLKNVNIHYGPNILKYPCLPKVESIILQPETLTSSHKYHQCDAKKVTSICVHQSIL